MYSFDTTAIDLRAANVVPGLIDAHVHFGLAPPVPLDLFEALGRWMRLQSRSRQRRAARTGHICWWDAGDGRRHHFPKLQRIWISVAAHAGLPRTKVRHADG